MATVPTPPEPAWMSTFCPVFRFARSTSTCQAVKPTRGMEAASSMTLLANARNTGMIQCKEQVSKESIDKEESHVDVSTRDGNHSRGNGSCGTSSVTDRDLGHPAA